MIYQWLMNFHICIMYHASTSWIVATQLARWKSYETRDMETSCSSRGKIVCYLFGGYFFRYYKYESEGHLDNSSSIYLPLQIPSDLGQLHCFQDVNLMFPPMISSFPTAPHRWGLLKSTIFAAMPGEAFLALSSFWGGLYNWRIIHNSRERRGTEPCWFLTHLLGSPRKLQKSFWTVLFHPFGGVGIFCICQ